MSTETKRWAVKFRPEGANGWCYTDDPQILWQHIEEGSEGDEWTIVVVPPMPDEEIEAMPEFLGW